jgi:ribosome-binding factor A
METTRQNKIARLIQKELSDIFQKQTSAMRGVLVSVSACRISPDLSIAKVFVSIFPSDRAPQVMQLLEAEKRTLRGELGRQVGSQLRIVPEIDFHLDSTLDYVEHIEELLKK